MPTTYRLLSTLKLLLIILFQRSAPVANAFSSSSSFSLLFSSVVAKNTKRNVGHSYSNNNEWQGELCFPHGHENRSNSYSSIMRAKRRSLVFPPAASCSTGPRRHFALAAASAAATGGGSYLENSPNQKSTITHSSLSGKKILVIGGSGRVGGSVVCQLVKHGAIVTVGGTKLESFERSKSRWIQQLYSKDAAMQESLKSVLFEIVNREDDVLMNQILNNAGGHGYDLVVHTAGPFQGKVNRPNGVLQACMDNGVGYIDVCDDYCTACAARAKYAPMALERGVPCIVSTGCWPGVSSLMAKQLTRSVLKEKPHLQANDLTVDFSFFTAGSGGAGVTLLVATFLILAEKSLVIVNGRRNGVDAMKEYKRVDFGNVVGEKDVGYLNLLEAASCHDILGIGNVKTLFGTAPSFWNTLLGVMARLPSSWLSDEALMEKLAFFSLPIVRLVDYFAGATNAMRVDVSCQKDPTVKEVALYAHENLEPCVGECVSAFCAALLNGSVKPGIWFPEEAIDTKEDVAAVLALASVGAHTVQVKSTCGLTQQDVWG